jgi:FkbM family methyltransferase
VRWQDGVWIHSWGDEKLPHPTVGGASPSDIFTAEVRDVFLYAYTPAPGDVVVDVGAGVGDSTLLFSKLVGDQGRVIAIEAHPRSYRALARLCDLNGLTNVTPLHAAAAETNGEVAITDLEDYMLNTVVDLSKEAPRVAVRARRLDDIAGDLGLGTIDLLKMNIEGAERAALEGMGELIDRTRHVCIGCHDFLADRGGAEQMRTRVFVCDFLSGRGFQISTRADDPTQPCLRDYVYGAR